jgi:hypothetical protein
VQICSQEKNQTYQEHNGDVQGECNESVEHENDVSDLLDICPAHVGHLNEQADDSVHDSASGSKVVERHKRVHLELGGREELLHHDQTGGLECNTGKLEEETGHDELDLAVGGNDHTKDDEGDIAEGLEVERGDAHDPGCQKDSNGCGGLEVSVRLWNLQEAVLEERTLSIWMKETERYR